MPIKSVLIHEGTWDEETRSHPALAWMEKYANFIDSRAFHDTPAAEWHAADFTFAKSDGHAWAPAETAWEEVKKVYAPFSEHFHQPDLLLCWETEMGWTMVGIALLWWKLLVAGPAGGIRPKREETGKEYDGVTRAAYKFEYVKEDGKIKLARTELYSDPSQAMVYMLKRGMLKTEDLMQSWDNLD